jgi:hypothetical protein
MYILQNLLTVTNKIHTLNRNRVLCVPPKNMEVCQGPAGNLKYLIESKLPVLEQLSFVDVRTDIFTFWSMRFIYGKM